MKIRIFAVAALIVLSSFFGACAHKEAEEPLKTKETSSKALSTTAQTTVAATELTEVLTTQLISTTAPATTLPLTTKAPATTKAPVRYPSSTDGGEIMTVIDARIYKDVQIELVESKYGVVERKYKTVYYQLVNNRRVDVGYEYTGHSFDRSDYSATYEELLPAARKNRETYKDYINENLRIINALRAEKGIAPLRLSEELTVMACARAEEIAWSGVHSHRRPDGTRCFTIFKEAGFNKGTAGENLGYVFDNPEDVCQAWKESRTHYENLMNPDFVEIGIGVAADPDEDGKLCWANHFLTA